MRSASDRPARRSGRRVSARRARSARSTVSQHITLRVDVVARREAHLPDAVVGLVPAAVDGLDHLLDDRQWWASESRRAATATATQLDDRAEDVELDLLVGGVADAHRAAAGVARAASSITASGPSSPPSTRVERMQPLGAALVRVDAAARSSRAAPRPRPASRARRARGGHRRVAQPAVAVVPVADAAELLRQARRRGGQDRAGRLVAQRPERQRAAQRPPRSRPPAGAASPTQSRHVLLGALPALGLGRRVRARCSSVPQRSSSTYGSPRRAVDARAGRRRARRRRRSPTSTPGAKSTIGSAEPSTHDAVAHRRAAAIGTCARSRVAARTRRSRSAVPVKHAHQRRATAAVERRAGGAVEAVGARSRPTSASRPSCVPGQVALAERRAAARRARRRSSPAGRPADAARRRSPRGRGADGTAR